MGDKIAAIAFMLPFPSIVRVSQHFWEGRDSPAGDPEVRPFSLGQGERDYMCAESRAKTGIIGVPFTVSMLLRDGPLSKVVVFQPQSP